MSSPALLLLSQKLTSTSSLLLERSRVLSLNLPPSASSQNQIVRNLTSIKAELSKLEAATAPQEGGGGSGGGSVAVRGSTGRKKAKESEREEGKQLREAGEMYDRLVEMFAEDEVGREKAKVLRRSPERPAAPDSIVDTSSASDPPKLSIPTSGSRPPSTVPTVEIEPPTPSLNPNLPFRDFPDAPSPSGSASRKYTPRPYSPEQHDDEEAALGMGVGMGERDILQGQQLLMQDQDDRLNLLSHSIGRQTNLSIQIGTELDHHHELLEDVDGAMDRTASRLGSARRRLDRVASDAKQHGSTITIVALIVILLLLIIVFKT